LAGRTYHLDLGLTPKHYTTTDSTFTLRAE
jgi:hypothetical protein